MWSLRVSQLDDRVPWVLALHTCAGVWASQKTLLQEGLYSQNLKTSTLQGTHPFYPWKLIKPCFYRLQELLVCLLWPQMDWSGMRSPTRPGGWQSHRIKEKLCLFSVQLRTRLWQECQHVYLAAKMLNESIEITFVFKETEYVMVSKSLFERSTKLYFLTNWSKYKI